MWLVVPSSHGSFHPHVRPPSAPSARSAS
jgi:hypothetical protein